MRTPIILTLSLLSLGWGLAQEPGPERLAGAIEEVTLYQGSAMVSRAVSLAAGRQGTSEVVIGPLPVATDPESVFADRVDGAVVRSVACRSRPPEEAEALAGQVAALDQAILELGNKIANDRNEIALRRIRQSYLRNLENFVAPAATQEMTHGVLQSKELEAITQMHFREYERASQEIMELDVQIQADGEQLKKLQAERKKLSAGPPVTYDAIVYLDNPEGGPASLRLNYLVRDCGWTPVYNFRGDAGGGDIEIEFNAMIHQVSGEDWRSARLALSTASPKSSAYNPRLTPLYVGVQDATQAQQIRIAPNVDVYNKAMVQKKEAMVSQLRGRSIEEMASQNFRANDSAASVQLIELSERMSELRLISEGAPDEDLSIRYELENPVTLVSRRDAQMVPVLRERAKAEFYHVAVPILTSAVFREAELTNATQRDLLGGQVNVFLDGEFTGRTDIPTIARGRSFTLGFGVDGQLRARRSLVDRRETVQGGNRQVEIRAEVVVDNYKDQPVRLRLRERTPFMEDTASLRVSLGDMSEALSTDSDYQRFEKPKGILRWDLEVPPGSGESSTTLRYGYSLEFDKSLTLRDISSEQKSRIRTEFMIDSKRAGAK